MSAHLDHLDDAQLRAVLAGLEGDVRATPPLLIVAGAGTGKTRTMAHRVAELILRGVDPHRVMLLTFSRRAARELTRRAEQATATALGRDITLTFPWSGTFHAVGAMALRRYAPSIGLDPAFSILDRGDAADRIDLCRQELGLARSDRRFPKKATCLEIYSLTCAGGRPLEVVLRRSFPWCAEWQDALRHLFRAYVEAKQAETVLDYDDLLLWWERLLEVPELAADMTSLVDAVLVDEYQDTNPLQARILARLRPDGGGLTVVGDDAQSIYAFRGAEIGNMLGFRDTFGPGTTLLALERNYRSTQPILDAAGAVIGLAALGFKKRLRAARDGGVRPTLAVVRDTAEEARWVAGEVLRAYEEGVLLKEQAVLFRTGHHAAELELELTRRNVPFVKFGGLRFLEAAHVKDLLALLRWGGNPRDRAAGFRVLQLMPGIGPGTARRLLAVVAADGWAGLGDAVHPSPAASIWPSFCALMSGLAGAPWPLAVSEALRFLEPLIPDLYDRPQPRLVDLAQLERIAQGYASREGFLADLALDPPEASGEEAGMPSKDEDWLVLSTVHSAKGQEWRRVYVLRCVDGCIPSDVAVDGPDGLEEERRLLYVAMTRARDRLTLVQPLSFYPTHQPRLGDRRVTAVRTRFLPASILHHFEMVVPRADDRPGLAEPPPVKVDLAAGIRAMWE